MLFRWLKTTNVLQLVRQDGGGGLLRAEIPGTTARLRQNPISGPVWAQDDSTTPPVDSRTLSHPPISGAQNAMETNGNRRQAVETLLQYVWKLT